MLAWLSFIFADCSDQAATINSFGLDLIYPSSDLFLDIDLDFDVGPHLYLTLTLSYTP